MITLPSLENIDSFLPQVPAFGDLAAVVGEVQATDNLVSSGAELAADTTEAIGVVGQALVPTQIAALQITNIMASAAAQAVATAPLLLNPITAPVGASQMQSIIADAVARCHKILENLRLQLQPMAQQLDAIADKPVTSRRPEPLILPPGTQPQPTVPVAQETPDPVAENAVTPMSSGNLSTGQAAVDAAKKALGVPYVWGGTSMNGFDCSGLTQWAYRQAGVELPRLAEHQNVGQAVNQNDLQPGDLLVWDGHVAMYAGDGQIIEAGNPVQMGPVRTTNMGMTFKGFFRPY